NDLAGIGSAAGGPCGLDVPGDQLEHGCPFECAQASVARRTRADAAQARRRNRKTRTASDNDETGAAMYTMILLLYLQQGLDVTLDQASLRGEYRTMPDCEAQARKLRGPLPIPQDMQAAWQDVMCVKINNNVHVNDMKPV